MFQIYLFTSYFLASNTSISFVVTICLFFVLVCGCAEYSRTIPHRSEGWLDNESEPQEVLKIGGFEEKANTAALLNNITWLKGALIRNLETFWVQWERKTMK